MGYRARSISEVGANRARAIVKGYLPVYQGLFLGYSNLESDIAIKQQQRKRTGRSAAGRPSTCMDFMALSATKVLLNYQDKILLLRERLGSRLL